MKKLSNSQIKYLRGLAHKLNAVVMIGDKGLTDSVFEEIAIALDSHELIKINIRAEDRDQKEQFIKRIISKTKAESVQTIGSKLVLYRVSKEKKIALPK